MFNLKRATSIYALAACLTAAMILGPIGTVNAEDNPPDFKTLNKQFHKAYDHYQYEKALELAGKLHELEPDDVSTLYNLACINCLLAKKDKAYEWLEKAIEAGFADVDYLKADDDFKTIRAEDRFRAIVKSMKDKAEPVRKKEAKAQPSDKKEKAKATKHDKAKETKQKKRDPGAEPDNAALQKVEALTSQLLRHSKAKRYEEALKCALEAHDVLDIGLTNYNVACMYALNGQKDKALKYLDRAAGMGFRDIGQNLVTQMKGDSDLDTLRDDPRYQKALKKAEKTEKAAAKREAKAQKKDAKKQEKKAKKDKPKKADKKPKKAKGEKKAAKAPVRLDSQTVAKVNELTRKAIRLSQANEYEEALEAAQAARKLWNSGTTNYNVACVLSLLGRADEAFKALDVAVEMGFDNPAQSMADKMREDSDLDTIREDPRFEKMLRKAGETAETKDSAPPSRQARDKAPTVKVHRSTATLSPEDRQEVTRLTQQLIEAARSNNVEKALEYGLEANKIADSGLTNYNVACMLSLLDRKEEAFDYLFKAAERGFDNFHQSLPRQMKHDPDLKALRGDPRFAEALRIAGQTVRKPQDPTPVGRPVEAQWKVTLPDNHDAKTPAPLLVVLHNYAGNMKDHTRIWKKAAKQTGVILLTPQGTWQLDDDGEQLQWGTDIDAVEEHIMEAIDAVMNDHAVDPDKIVLAGFSQGGALTWELGIRNPDTFCGMIPVGGYIDEIAPAEYDKEDIAAMRAFIMVGDQEPAHIIDANKKATKMIKQLGAQAKIRIYENLGHVYPKNATQEQVKAIKYVLQS